MQDLIETEAAETIGAASTKRFTAKAAKSPPWRSSWRPGVTATGGREIRPGCRDSEDEVFWRYSTGRCRGWRTSGAGSTTPANLLALVPKSHKDMVAAVFRTAFARPDPAAVSAAWDTVRDQLTHTFPKIGGVDG